VVLPVPDLPRQSIFSEEAMTAFWITLNLISKVGICSMI